MHTFQVFTCKVIPRPFPQLQTHLPIYPQLSQEHSWLDILLALQIKNCSNLLFFSHYPSYLLALWSYPGKLKCGIILNYLSLPTFCLQTPTCWTLPLESSCWPCQHGFISYIPFSPSTSPSHLQSMSPRANEQFFKINVIHWFAEKTLSSPSAWQDIASRAF